MGFSLRTCFFGKIYYHALQVHLLPQLDRYGVTPNLLTFTGLAFAVLVPFGFYAHPIFGSLLILVSGIADSLDGMLARFQNKVSPFGAFLDSSLDRLSDFFYLAGFWVLFWPSTCQILATILILAALLFTALISYVKARAEALNIECCVGVMERGARVVFLLIWALLTIVFNRLPVVLWSGLTVYAGLALWTVIQRVFYIRNRMVCRDNPR